jgi:hypothetical protein
MANPWLSSAERSSKLLWGNNGCPLSSEERVRVRGKHVVID